MTASTETSYTDTPRTNPKGVMITVLSLVLFIFLVLVLFANRFFAPANLTPAQLSNDHVRVLTEPRPLALGKLTNHLDEPVTAAFFSGKWSLVFFGFTHCPDICPTTLHELNIALKQLPPQLAAKVNVTLVSVDPTRDSAQVLKNYVTGFNESFTGITGEFVALKSLANSASVPFFKVPNTGPHAEHLGTASYQIDHGAQIVVVNPEGKYHAFFKAPIKAEHIAKNLPAVITAFN